MGNLLGCFLTNESRSGLSAPGSVVKAFLIYLNKYVTQCVVGESKCHPLVEVMDQTSTEANTLNADERQQKEHWDSQSEVSVKY